MIQDIYLRILVLFPYPADLTNAARCAKTCGEKRRKVVLPINNNETMMQYFEWYLANDGLWWKRCAAKAGNLASLGITQVWLPPAYKAASQNDVGYGVYDMYDLGEFDQKGTIRTKYGTRDEFLDAVDSYHAAGIKVFGEIVLNHRMGGDSIEKVTAVTDSPENRLEQIGGEQEVSVWSKFSFPGRGGKYSRFKWDHRCFTGTDWDENTQNRDCIYRFAGKRWDPYTDPEKGNFDYLMGMNVDMHNPKVVSETKKWLRWYLSGTGVDGLRLDAVKHIRSPFYRDLLCWIRSHGWPDLPAVGEYWSGDPDRLKFYLDSVDNEMSLFDVALHYKFYEASEERSGYDLRGIFENTLVSERPESAVTFVDNHDTQQGQSLQSYVADWFKPLAYAMILLRKDGIPCVFYTDYYGSAARDTAPVLNLGKLIRIRRFYAYGEQEDCFADKHLIGWVRRGDEEHAGSGLAVVMSNAEGGSLKMFMGKSYAGERFRDVTGGCHEEVIIGEDGIGSFRTENAKVSVWVRDPAFENIIIND